MGEVKEVIIFTDGACDPNPGAGGYGIVLLYGKHRKELSDGFRLTTNNRMELLAAIVALETLKKPCKVKLYSDSQYLVDSVTFGRINRWKSKNWRKIKNPDLWERLLEQCARHQIEFLWVKGHSGNIENERCDELAVKACKIKNLNPDEFYESNCDPNLIKATQKKVIANNNNKISSTSNRTQKITQEGQSCRKCSTPVIKHIRPKNKPVKSNRSYYYEYFFMCPECRTQYFVKDAIKYIEKSIEQPKLF